MHNFLTVLLVFATTSAWADWIDYEETDDADFYLDPTTIRKNGEFRRVWTLQNSRSSKKRERSSLHLQEYDCGGERVRLLSLSTHSGLMGAGKVLFSHTEVGEWDYVAPRTVGAAALKLVCAP